MNGADVIDATSDPQSAIEHVHVLGLGRMGQGIALAFAFAGLGVTLIDFKEREAADYDRSASQALAAIAGQLATLERLQRISAADAQTVLARVAVHNRHTAVSNLGSSAIVFEAVPERIDAKEAALKWVVAHCHASTILASTTSTFLVTALQDLMPSDADAARVINTHWLNPAHLMPLIEVSRSARNAPSHVERVLSLLRAIGKVPVVCAPSPGFIVPRIQAQAMNEAARMVEEGVASAEDIDLAIRTGFGLRFSVLGLLEFIDWGGCDILFYASKYLSEQLGERFTAADIVQAHMRDGQDGLRTGQGFFDYANRDVQAYVDQRMGAFSAMLDHLGHAPVLNAAKR
ncbi:3-hydroxybutyryl-CoA dehydrogenase [Robbsia sp. KACC 23696]|uniref:3-hydroxybutyryl-CoA dehydrogenase n=1 Tax=Robbsia sp. KACC 23696 TaxID=3149231 RepID=UPI00325BD964